MQLKRDTDYALRMLLYLARQEDSGESGIAVPEISRQTSIPVAVASRLCKKLENARLLKMVESAGHRAQFAPHNDVLDKTVFDVICAAEGNCSLFAVFDKTTELYAAGKDVFETIERKLADALAHITIGELKENIKNFL